MTELTDTDPMPFGKHRSIPMSDVPVNYLHWMWHNGPVLRNETRTNPVADYIRRNLDALKKENSDLIWS